MSFYWQLCNNNLDHTKFYNGFTFFRTWVRCGFPNLISEFVRLFFVEQCKIRDWSCFYFILHANRGMQANFGTCPLF